LWLGGWRCRISWWRTLKVQMCQVTYMLHNSYTYCSFKA
jgi:hypothetical protein